MAERRRSVTHGELDSEMLAQSKQLTEYFDRRLKDSERVLTWRMVAVNSIAVGAAGVIGKVLTDPSGSAQAISSVIRSVV